MQAYDPAFPSPTATWQAHGLSTRDYVALRCLNVYWVGTQGREFYKARAREAYALADAMIEVSKEG